MKRAKQYFAAVCFVTGALLAGCGAAQSVSGGEAAAGGMSLVGQATGDTPFRGEPSGQTAPDGTERREEATAGEGETAATVSVGYDGMQAVYPKDIKAGSYAVRVDSSSSMFHIVDCTLTVRDGSMTALLTMSGSGYAKLYLGTGRDAAAAADAACILCKENAEGASTFEIPVEALDKELACAAYSRKKEKWYDRTLVFRADSLPPEAFSDELVKTPASLGLSDGVYSVGVTLGGGSGRARVETPASLRVEDGRAFATIVWGSTNYDYMIVDGERYEACFVDEKSAFEIPAAAFDRPVPVLADTTAMGAPHEIAYTLTFDSGTLREAEKAPARQEEQSKEASDKAAGRERAEKAGFPVVADCSWMKLKQTGSLPLRCATQFAVDFYENGYALITVAEDGRYLVVPEGGTVWDGIPKEVTILKKPLERIYLVATSSMDLFCELDGLSALRFSGTRAGDWYIKEAKEAMEAGTLLYAGKYSAPDYERLVSERCGLAVESTMIHHTPEVKEKLEALGIPVFVERSSYEPHPLGRMEWIKLYGVLLDQEERADSAFDDRLATLEPVLKAGPAEKKKTVAFFYITSNGSVSVRTSKDYVARMIELAGGSYVPQTAAGESSAVSMQMEEFFAAARDADYLIYSSAVGGSLGSLDEFLAKSPLLSQFKAVKEGHVFCTGKNLFQETMSIGSVILELNRMVTEDEPKLSYFYRLE